MELDINVAKKLTYSCNLLPGDIERYSRQIVLPEFGVRGQKSLRDHSFLVIGAGGLGCSAAIHLAGSGAGKLTIVDHDKIESSNLHRQILYSPSDVGSFKAKVLAEKCSRLNPDSPVIPICELLTIGNALELVSANDIIMDCTDNVFARYLLNDACVLQNKALVSASALKFDGQLTVYNHDGSPCRRCLFPDSKIMQTQSCDDNGVMGPVPGIMGSLQAMEAIKLAAGLSVSFAGNTLHYNALSGSFYRIKLRGRNPACPVCGDQPRITLLHEDHLGNDTCSYALPLVSSEKLLKPADRISVSELQNKFNEEHEILVDVRTETELQICGFKDSLNIPFQSLLDESLHSSISCQLEERFLQKFAEPRYVTVICRRGNDSQLAVHILRDILKNSPVKIRDVSGGLYSWKKEIDPLFPIY